MNKLKWSVVIAFGLIVAGATMPMVLAATTKEAPKKEESRAEKAARERAEKLQRQREEREAKLKQAKAARDRKAKADFERGRKNIAGSAKDSPAKPENVSLSPKAIVTRSSRKKLAEIAKRRLERENGNRYPDLKRKKTVPLPGYTLPKDCTSVFSCWCAWYQAKWGTNTSSFEPLEQEKLNAISDHYIDQCEAAVRSKPNYETYLAFGEALMFRNYWEEAREALQKGLSMRREETLDGVRFHYRIAETYFAQNKISEALGELQRAVDLNIRKVPRNHQHWPSLSFNSLLFLTDKDFDFYKMPRDTGCKPFPEPHEAKYFNSFEDCRRVQIEVRGGIKADDPRISLLKKKLTARGVEVGSEGFKIMLSLDRLAPVAKPEGYSIDVSTRMCTIRARDKQGILWGIVSFLQLMDNQNLKVRRCKINDWPDTERRGYLGNLWPGCMEYTVFNKLNFVVVKFHPMADARWSPLHVYQCEALAKEFRELGLTLHFGIKSWTEDMAWSYCWNSYLGMQIEVGKKFAEMGAGIYYPNDDVRYEPDVLRKEDLATGQKPSDFDAPHILELFKQVKEEYPDFTMVYCPPFYWGPNAGHPYPDDREKYLRSLRMLPEDVSIIWTGDRVKSYKKTPAMVKWFVDLTGHKPLLFQNGTGPHNRISYIVDRTDWNGWHYPGFFEKDIYGYLKNSATPEECPQISTLADCMWNVKGYDQERSIRRGLAQFAGKGFFEALDPVLNDLSYIDKFGIFAVYDTSVRDEDPKKVSAMYERIQAATKKAAAINGSDFLDSMGRWTWAVGVFAQFVDVVKNPPDFHAIYKEQLDRTRAQARAAGYRPENGDILLTGADLHHSQCKLLPETPYRGKPPPNQLYVCGVWDGCIADADFVLNNIRAKGDVKIIMNAMFDRAGNQKPSGQMKLSLNGKAIYEGPYPFRRYEYVTHEFHAPQSMFNLNGKNHISYWNGLQNWQLWINFIIIKFQPM